MHAIAIGRLRGDVDAATREVAQRLGRSGAEIHHRLGQGGDDPIVLGVVREADAAGGVVGLLRGHGFEAFASPVHGAIAALVVARSFALGADALQASARDGRSTALGFDDVELVLLATRVEAPTPARAPPGASGRSRPMASHLVHAYTQAPGRATPGFEESLAFVFTAAAACVLREHELQYRSLGAAVSPSRGANFRHVVQTLRERCPHAQWDARLQRQATQAHILGPMAAIDRHLELAAALLAMVLPRGARTPYR